MTNFIEYLEEMVDLKKNCSIRFKAGNDGIAVIKTRLSDINSEGGEGYVKTIDGLKININQLIEVNGRPVQNFC